MNIGPTRVGILFSDLVVAGACILGCFALTGCVSTPESPAASSQRAEANLVVNFQSWNSISFIKPDVTGSAGSMTLRPRTFSKEGFVKLLNNLKVPRQFVVVVLDRRYSPDPTVTGGGMEEIQKFFEGLGFRRVAFQDSDDMRILRDTSAGQAQ